MIDNSTESNLSLKGEERYSMSQEDRIVQIYELLKEKHSLTYHDLMNQFGISRDTVRRDIVKLVNMGYAVRTYGGLMLNTKDSIIIDYQERINVNADIKQALAAQAVTYINEERKVIFFDASTSVNEVCRLVNENVIAYCANMPSIEVLASHCEAHLMGGFMIPYVVIWLEQNLITNWSIFILT